MALNWLIWMLPGLFVLHDGEEILTWNWWMRRKGTHIFAFGRSTGDWASRNGRQMTAAVAVVGATLLAGTVQGVLAVASGNPPYLYAAVLAIWLLHTALHLASSLYHRLYTPGVVTALLICLPYGLWAYMRLLSTGSLTWTQAVASGAAGLAIAPAMLWLAHRTGRMLVKG